jgi:hypothetical protein
MERVAAAAPPTVPARMVLPPLARLLLALMVAGASVAAIAAFRLHGGAAGWGAFALLAPLTLVAAFLDAPLGSETSAKILTAPLVAAALLLPPSLLVVCAALAAMWVYALVFAPDTPRNWLPDRAWTARAQATCTKAQDDIAALPRAETFKDVQPRAEALRRRAIAAARTVVSDVRQPGEIGDDAPYRFEEELDRAERSASPPR